ncbi:MAG: hypothetical protein AAGD22_06555 [Verrucomicrobiota bacterium]
MSNPPPHQLNATLTRGHRVASGLAGDPRFPKGTIALQIPFFKEHGLDLLARGLHTATLNLSISPHIWKPVSPTLTLKQIDWTPDFPPEDFSFFDCQLKPPHARSYVEALVYYPHPDTKPDYHQSPSTIEVLAPKLPDVTYGDTFALRLSPHQIEIW